MEKNNFEKLVVWKKAHSFVLEIYSLTKKFPSDEKYLLVNQIRRSSSSIVANIVEGNEKKSKKEFIQFLYISKASLAETKYHLLLAKDLNYIDNKTYLGLIDQANEIGKLINGLINYLTSKVSDLSSKIYHLRSKNSFTLIEILVVFSTILVMGSIIYFALTYKNTKTTAKNSFKSTIIQSSADSNNQIKPQAKILTGNNTTVMTMQATASEVNHKENETIFSNIAPNTDAVYKKIKNGIKEEIIIKAKPEEKPVYNFLVETDGLTIERINGQYYFFDKTTGQAQITIPKPFMIDASGARSEAISISLVKSGKNYLSKVIPDYKWLTAPERQYPVIVDPTLVTPDSPIRELIYQRTENTKTYSLGDNKFVAVSAPGRLYFQNQTNSFQEKDPTITASDDSEYDYINNTNSFKTYFSSDGFGQKKAVKFQVDDAWMKFKLAGASGQGSLTNNEYNQFSYQGVYQNGNKKMDAVYTLSDNQLLEEIVLNEFQGYPEITQEIELSNAYFRSDGKKINAYHKVTNKLLWVIPEPVMYEKDNREVQSFGLHYQMSCLDNNVTVEQCSHLSLTKVIDQEGRDWLADPTRQYPLVIDLTAGPNSPSSASNDDSVGEQSWSSYGEGTIFESDDRYWKAIIGNYGGSITELQALDNKIYLLYYGNIAGSNLANENPWDIDNPDGIKTYGYTTASISWQPDDINDSAFGLVFSAKGDGFDVMNYETNYLVAQGFGFEIDPQADVTGIRIDIEAFYSTYDLGDKGDYAMYVDHITTAIQYTLDLNITNTTQIEGLEIEGMMID